MQKLIIVLGLAVLVAPRGAWTDPIVLDNDEYHVHLADSWAKIVDETHEKYNYTFEITDKKKNIQSKIKIKDYAIENAFLTSHYLNVLVHVLPPGTNGRTPVCKYNQYDLSTLKKTAAIGHLQDAFFSPAKKFAILRSTYNPYQANEFNGLSWADLTNGPPQYQWLCNEKEKVNIFKREMGNNKKYYDLVSPVAWSPDEKQMVFIVAWDSFNQEDPNTGQGYLLAYLKNLDGKLIQSAKPIDFTQWGYMDLPWVTQLKFSKGMATMTIQKSPNDIKSFQVELPK
jgi:hypothetical protein